MQPWTLVIAVAVLFSGGTASADGVGGAEWAEAVVAGDGAVPSVEAERGISLLMKAAEGGEAQAQYGLGMLFLTGRLVTQDDTSAAEWLARAAAAGVGPAESNLGFLYLQGRGVARDPTAAAVLLRRAAAKNIAAAQHNLGWMAQMGEGGPKEIDAAIGWYGAAAQSGYSQSQYNLGVLLADGPRDAAGAVKWLSLAGLSPHPDVRRRATEKLVTLSRSLSPTVVAQGVDEARRWLADGRVY